jgi:streptogramin lyase
VAETVTNIPIAAAGPGVAYNWVGGALGGDGKVYCAPFQRAEVLVIDPATSAVSYLNVPNFPLVKDKYAGAVTGPDGKVYCVPYNASSVMCIDPFTSVVSSFGNVGTAAAKWYGGSLAPDGRIYCAPYMGGNVLVIDTLTKTVSTLAGNLANCAGAVLAPGAGYGEWATHFVPRKSTAGITGGTAFASSVYVSRVSHGLATVPAWLTGANMSKL